ncbi:hypothetical protein [Sinorhizobium fredii]|uniref:hypothetical protein n=1 Tax=Rhizobium fredii TaxID=380 RepID=UPI0004AEEB4B|nr:hypothetical protein [Sinorhizobium fredii]ASY68853.1 Phage-related protein [Sinorhizobium fredii CCBAU 83666]
MTDHPFLFSGPMVRALLDGRKTQTRRILTPHNTLFDGRAWSKLTKAQQWDWPKAWVDGGPSPAGNPGPYLKLPWLSGAADPFEHTIHRIYPKVQPGDRIWVKETWAKVGDNDDDIHACPDLCRHAYYRADSVLPEALKWRPSIFMQRWSSRITLPVTSVKIEHLQDISEEDAIAEGIARNPHGNGDQWLDYPAGSSAAGWLDPRQSYRSLWQHINGPASWEENPWVLAYSFDVQRKNIDEAGR